MNRKTEYEQESTKRSVPRRYGKVLQLTSQRGGNSASPQITAV
jgi:hypothetical protein